jgi:beta-galactosidase
VREQLVEQIRKGSNLWLFGPRTGAKSDTFSIEPRLPPGKLQEVLPMRVVAVESLRPSMRPTLGFDGIEGSALRWRDHAEPAAETETIARFDDGLPAVLRNDRVTYATAVFDRAVLRALMMRCARDAGIETLALPEGLRLRRRGALRFAINYGDKPRPVPAAPHAEFLLGGPVVGPVDVAVWVEG